MGLPPPTSVGGGIFFMPRSALMDSPRAPDPLSLAVAVQAALTLYPLVGP